jgi:hypothetical protein
VTSPLSGWLVRTHRWRRWARPPSLDLYLLLVDGVPVKVVSGQPVVGVRVVDAGCREVVEPLARAGLRLGDIDDFEDLGTAEAGDLHGTGAGEVRTCAGEGVGMCRQPLSPQHILKAEERMPRVPWP